MRNKSSVLTLRLPNELKHKIELTAQKQGVSLNQLAMYAFTKEVLELESASHFSRYWKGKAKGEVFGAIDGVIKKIKRRPVPLWDKL